MQNMVSKRSRTRSTSPKQYGINMANVLNTRSNLKTAKLKQEGMQSELDTAEEEDVAYGNRLLKDGKEKLSEADTDGDGIVSPEEKKNAVRKVGRRYGAHSKMRKDDDTSANIHNAMSNRNARTGIAQSRENRLAKEAKAKFDHWQKETKRVEDARAGLEKVTYDNLRRQGENHETAQAISKVNFKEANDYIKRVEGMADHEIENEITISREVTKGLYNIGAEADPEKQQALMTKAKEGANVNLRKASESGDSKWIETAQELVDTMTKITDKNGKVIPEKLSQVFANSTQRVNELETMYGKKKDENDIKERTRGQQDTRSTKAYSIIENIATKKNKYGEKEIDNDYYMQVATEVDKIMQKDKKIKPATAVDRAMKKIKGGNVLAGGGNNTKGNAVPSGKDKSLVTAGRKPIGLATGQPDGLRTLKDGTEVEVIDGKVYNKK